MWYNASCEGTLTFEWLNCVICGQILSQAAIDTLKLQHSNQCGWIENL
jgi:hypothetical protein